MGRERLSFPFILVLSLGAFLLLQHFAYSKEFRRKVTCYNDIFHLDCGNDSFVAVHEAYFTAELQTNQTCLPPPREHDEYIEDEDVDTEPTNNSSCYEDIRVLLNRKCSGLKNCNYSYSDETEKKCSNPEGSYVVRYDCVKGSTVKKFCNTKLHEREGYIISPGYPQYYPELDVCFWNLTAAEGQTILLKILHLHLSPATEIRPTESDIELYGVLGQLIAEPIIRCDDDSLTVLEGNVKRLSLCGEAIEALQTLEADASNGLTLSFKSVAFRPASGFLVYFKIQGCPDLHSTEGSYLLERNGSAAIYACSGNQVFNDTQENTRFLSCVRDHHWNDTLAPCTTLEETTTTTLAPNKSQEVAFEYVNATSTKKPIMPSGPAYLEAGRKMKMRKLNN
ncbi:uncharacterized protein LOC118205585 isoform X2 [Stegodyphus dumicola]|uniref:uncharacterized protein LOC118205585 isoform X2 n=1 Tax=Stegodyphus dumicola TaxID=202533 RepID=UPI0015A999CA|nr:uncharacterized protein LOC118205585 isoform X2 [Stegodyphus dumicola]